MINYSCPHCGHHTKVDPSYAGKTGPCAKCGKDVTIPKASQDPRAPVSGRPSSSGGGYVLMIVLAIIFGGLGLVGVAVLGCCGFGFYSSFNTIGPAVTQARTAARRAACTNNMKQIGLAMHNYYDVHGELPPAYSVDEDGKPLHSWRVLILPYLGEGQLYDQFKLDEPWDSSHNLEVADQMPMVYGCPDGPQSASITSYVVINEPGAVFDGSTATKFSEVTDGTSNTIMLVETANSGIRWNEPRDFDFNQASALQSDHPGGANVSLVDGSVRFVPVGFSRSELKNMTTKAGGEPTVGLP